MEDNSSSKSSVYPYVEVCAMEHLFAMIGGKWKMRILCSLYYQDSMRYNELKRALIGVSPTVLSTSLKELESDGFIKRVQYEEMPVRVVYSLTDKFKSLAPILIELKDWIIKEEKVGSCQLRDTGR